MQRPKNPSWTRLLAAATLAATASCVVVIGDGWGGDWSRPRLRGSGVELRESRSVGEFHGVRVRHGVDVEVRVGAEASVEIVGDDNLVRHVECDVDDGTLVLGIDDEFTYVNAELRAIVVTPVLESVAVAGSSSVVVRGLLGGEIALSIEGSGDLEAFGRVEHLDATIEGSGDLDLEDLHARTARVRVSGSGDVDVRAEEQLDVVIRGSGNVVYFGDPRTVVDISGSGSFERD